MLRFRKQADRFGTDIVEFEEVCGVRIQPEGGFSVQTNAHTEYRSRALLIATGSQPRKLNIPGEKELYGRGVSYCATCDGPLFRGKDVIIVGAGNSGLQEGLHLLHFVNHITMVEFLPTSKGEKILQERMFNHQQVEVLFNHTVTAIEGEQTVTGVRITNRQTGEEKVLPAGGVFIYIGYKPDTEFLAGMVDMNPVGYIKTDALTRTSVPGIFAAGDVRADNLAQVAVAVGDGAKAALAIREYLANR
jgi:thioredoxin reductase (NADPH)